MKKMICLFLALLLVPLLASCDRAPAASEEEPTADASSVRLAYLQTLVGELNAELLSLKQELYLQGVQYETRIEELEAALRSQGGNSTENGNDVDNENASPSDFAYVLSGGEATVTGYHGKETSVTVPDTLGGCPVVALGERAFAGNTSLRSVVLPERLRSVGWFAFSGCVSLSSVTLSASVESIAYGAFDGCHRSLTLRCPRDSYAQQYAHSYGLGVEN